MMKSEFIERVGFEPTAAEYADIEAEYMGTDVDKDRFCKEWKKNGGVQRMMRLRARRIEELETEAARKDRLYEKMDARHCAAFNQMNDSWKQKVEGLEAQLRQSGEANDSLNRLLQEAEAARKEAEEKLATVKAAFAILGIGKEEKVC